MRSGEEMMWKVKLVIIIRRRKKKGTHVDGKKVAAVATSNSHSLKQTAARNAHSKDGVTEVAMDITELIGGREEVLLLVR